jgi:hypothetical protein
MSSGSQNGTSVGGLQGMRIRDASDVITQTKLRLAYITNNQSNSGYSGVNAYRSKGVQNGYNFLLQVQEGLRECGVSNVAVAGQPFAGTVGTTKNAAGTDVTIASTIPVRP